MVHIETDIDSTYGIHQENGMTTVQTDENQVHIETGANPAYRGVHQGKGMLSLIDFYMVKVNLLIPVNLHLQCL